MSKNFKKKLAIIAQTIEEQNLTKREILKDLDLFVLDNSIRENTVGQLRGHTLENKIKIYEEVKKRQFKEIIVASFNHMTRVGDAFCQYLLDKKEDMSNLWSFSEVTESWKNQTLDTVKIPVSLRKMEQYKIPNAILEIDLADESIDWKEKFTIDDMCALLLKRIKWCHNNLSEKTRILVNFRDFAFAMKTTKGCIRVLTVVDYLGGMPDRIKPFGVCMEEPGKFLPEEVGAWCASVRRVMNNRNWKNGKLLAHIHKRWGLAQVNQLESLMGGADGIWAGVCEEGAGMGHASSTLTIMNLIRMGNTKVLKKYNCTYLRKAAINVTEITTGNPPHYRELVYGERALDLWLPGDDNAPRDFDMAKFFGEEAPSRITDVTSADMIINRLVQLFGENPAFTFEITNKMKELMLEDMCSGRKEEYMSEVGLALLFDRAGGKLTENMCDAIDKMKIKHPYHESLLNEVKALWDKWDINDEIIGDDCLQFDSFYNGFMSPYFGCFRCDDTRKGLKCLDMDEDGLIDWKEFKVYLKWALHEYQEISSMDRLLSYTFRKGLIPAMQDETLTEHSRQQDVK